MLVFFEDPCRLTIRQLALDARQHGSNLSELAAFAS